MAVLAGSDADILRLTLTRFGLDFEKSSPILACVPKTVNRALEKRAGASNAFRELNSRLVIKLWELGAMVTIWFLSFFWGGGMQRNL